MLKKVGDPLRVLDICFPSWDSLHMAGIYHHRFQVRRFKDVIQRLPIRSGALHSGHFTAAVFEPVSKCKKLSGCCTKLSYFLLVALSEAGDDKFFVHINTTTFVVNSIHNDTSMENLRHGFLSVIILLYVLLPQAAGQMVVQMRKPKISLENGLQAQSQIDLCR